MHHAGNLTAGHELGGVWNGWLPAVAVRMDECESLEKKRLQHTVNAAQLPFKRVKSVPLCVCKSLESGHANLNV